VSVADVVHVIGVPADVFPVAPAGLQKASALIGLDGDASVVAGGVVAGGVVVVTGGVVTTVVVAGGGVTVVVVVGPGAPPSPSTAWSPKACRSVAGPHHRFVAEYTGHSPVSASSQSDAGAPVPDLMHSPRMSASRVVMCSVDVAVGELTAA